MLIRAQGYRHFFQSCITFVNIYIVILLSRIFLSKIVLENSQHLYIYIYIIFTRPNVSGVTFFWTISDKMLLDILFQYSRERRIYIMLAFQSECLIHTVNKLEKLGELKLGRGSITVTKTTG